MELDGKSAQLAILDIILKLFTIVINFWLTCSRNDNNWYMECMDVAIPISLIAMCGIWSVWCVPGPLALLPIYSRYWCDDARQVFANELTNFVFQEIKNHDQPEYCAIHSNRTVV
jgi:hypothetical protein